MNDYLCAELHRTGNPKSQSVAVLVVEDEHLIRMDTASFLDAAGFAVYEADNAADAIRILELDDEIRLIFTDINMPGSMDGSTRTLCPRTVVSSENHYYLRICEDARQRPPCGGALH